MMARAGAGFMWAQQLTYICERRGDVAELACHGAVQDPADRVQVVPAQTWTAHAKHQQIDTARQARWIVTEQIV